MIHPFLVNFAGLNKVPNMLQQYQNQFLLHLTIFIWGFTGILGKLIHLDPIVIVWYRVIIAAIGLFAYIKYTRLTYFIRDRKQLFYLIIVGIITSLHWITFYQTIAMSTASLGILCLSTVTLHVTWLEPLIMKKKFSWSEFAMGLIVIFGIYYVSTDLKVEEMGALAMGLISAFLAAVFSVGNAKLSQTIATPLITFYEMIVGALFITGLLAATDKLNLDYISMTTSDFWWLIFLGLICTSFAFVTIINVVKKLGAFTVSLSVNLEPVYTIILAIFILNEHELVGPKFYIGASIIICTVAGNALLKSYQSKKQIA